MNEDPFDPANLDREQRDDIAEALRGVVIGRQALRAEYTARFYWKGRRHREARWTSAEELAELSTIPPEAAEPDTALYGWRFGVLTPEGAIASPWIKQLGWSWPPEGLRAVCVSYDPFQSARATATGRTDGARVFAPHNHEAPVAFCNCGLYLCASLSTLVDRLTTGGEAVDELVRRYGEHPYVTGRPFWRHAPCEVIYEAYGWGPYFEYPRKFAFGDDMRFRFVRVNTFGGTAYIPATHGHHAEALAERYGLNVAVIDGDGEEWLARALDHHARQEVSR